MLIQKYSQVFRFSQVDAFTTKRWSGNPCAIIHDADRLTDEDMLNIAREMNLSETAFVLSARQGDFRFRFFTPAEEIPLAGHPTIATVHRLWELGKISSERSSLQIELNAGMIEVRLEHSTNSPPLITMKQPAPQFLKTYDPEDILPLFSLSAEDLLEAPIQTVNTGTPMLMVPVRSLSSLRKISFHPTDFATYRKQSDFFSAHIFCLEGFSNEGQTAARHFCPPPDVLEDAFTGSATGAMGCYLWNYNLLRTPSFIAQQGDLMKRPGEGTVRVLTQDKNIVGVEVQGRAVTVMTGELFL